jgi:hypothetical protein
MLITGPFYHALGMFVWGFVEGHKDFSICENRYEKCKKESGNNIMSESTCEIEKAICELF